MLPIHIKLFADKRWMKLQSTLDSWFAISVSSNSLAQELSSHTKFEVEAYGEHDETESLLRKLGPDAIVILDCMQSLYENYKTGSVDVDAASMV